MSQPKKIAAARKAAKLRNWRAWLLRQRAQPLGTVEARTSAPPLTASVVTGNRLQRTWRWLRTTG